MSKNIKSYINNESKSVKIAKENLRWLKRINKRFNLLKWLFKKQPIYIQSNSCFEKCEYCDGKPKYLDISIKLPSLPSDYIYYIINYFSWIREFKELPSLKETLSFYKFRWIFTLDNFSSYVKEHSPSDIHADFFIMANKSVKSIIAKVDDIKFVQNIARFKKLLSKKPIIEFDDIFTDRDFFTKIDMIFFTKMWIKKFYPSLSNRDIIIVEPKDLK